MIDTTKIRFNNSPGSNVDACKSEYVQHDGLLFIPVMDAEEAAPQVVRVCAPYTERQSTFDYVRTGSPPLVPAPGDVDGYTYLGGSITVPAPSIDSEKNIVYSAKGMYNFVGTSDLKSHGQIRFDAHGYLSLVDFLGWFDISKVLALQSGGNNWNNPTFDLDILGSARILG